MTADELSEEYSATRAVLRNIGLGDEFFRSLVAARLLVERVGETTNLGWWDSRVLSETGRTRLEEITPKTLLRAQIDLASKVGEKAEADRLQEDAISLFDFGPQIESQVSAALDDATTTEDRLHFDELKSLSIESLNKGWTKPLLAEIGSKGSESLIGGDFPNESGATHRLDEQGYTPDEVRLKQWDLLKELLRAYGQNTEALKVPYFPLQIDHTGENA